MSDVYSLTVITGFLSTMLILATPLLLAALGETISQNSGVVNLGVNGIMLLSAFFAFYVVLMTESLFLGILAAIATGLAMGLIMSLVSITLKAEQGVSGIGLNMFGLGLSSLLFKVLVGTVKTVGGMPKIALPLLSKIPLLGPVFFEHHLFVYFAFAMVPLLWWILERTTWGLTIKSVGQNPAAADSRGINVNLVRYICVTSGAVMAGLAGASLSIATLNLFQDNLTAGQGFIAVALVYFGGWSPVGVMWGALLFSAANSVQLWMQVLGVPVPASLANMLPYLLTVITLTFSGRRNRKPGALNKPFFRGEA
ncbi:MAG: ABC transporter permease [Spirochaetales bacterium]|nr:ABC transporter permease [Spirochaetales bacterium]